MPGNGCGGTEPGSLATTCPKRSLDQNQPQTLREASLEELIDEVSDRLTGRMADDSEIRELAFRGIVHSYQTSGDRLSFVSIEPFAKERGT